MMGTLLEIQKMISDYRKKWITMGRWTDPNPADSLLFLWTELYELRNTVIKSEYRLEAFDALMMALISLEKLCLTLVEIEAPRYGNVLDKWDDINSLYLEAVENYLRTKTYTRNNGGKDFTNTALSALCFILLKELGDTPISTSSKKLDMMDKKRNEK